MCSGVSGLLLLIVMVGQSAEDVYEIPQGLRALNDCMCVHKCLLCLLWDLGMAPSEASKGTS